MAIKWRSHLIIIGLLFALVGTFASCGGDDPVDNDDPNQQPQPTDDCESDDDCGDDRYCILETCYDQAPIDCDDNSQCGADFPYCVEDVCYHSCQLDDHCDHHMEICNDDGQCIPDPAAECIDHDDCGNDYCHDGTCVSEGFICTLQNCAGQRGVCNPEAGADGDCINADSCSSLDACVEGYLCIDNQCEEEDVACADCVGDEQCVFNADTLSVSCEDDSIVCEPAGHRECIDENTLYICSSDGSVQQNVPCPFGCNEDELRCEQSPGETCEDAYEVEDGDSFEFDWIEFSNTYEPDGSEGCIDPADDLRVISSDVVFALEIEPGQVGVVEVYTPFDNTMIYMFEQCPDLDIGEAYSCQEPTGHLVEQLDGQVRRSFWYENSGSQNETVYIVADSAIGAQSDGAVIDITISDQICTPGQSVCSDGELGECSIQGTHFLTDSDRSCALGCYSDDPTDGFCQAKPHSVCDDAEVYDGPLLESYTYDIIDFTGPEGWDTGNCLNTSIGSSRDEEFDGRTAYFAVDLLENERLNANLASQFNAGLWLRDGCEGFCHVASNQSDDVESLQYIADEDQTVYVVVHAVEDDIEFGEFTLDLTVDEPLCEGYDAGHVLGCTDDDAIQFCVGSDYADRYYCDGECLDGTCVDPTGDSCVDTIPISSGDTFEGSFGDVSNRMRHLECGGQDFDSTPTGPDTIFELEIDEPNQLIQIELSTSSDSAGIYLLDDCPIGKDSDDFSDECVAGAIPSDEHIDFFVDEAGTYFLVVDSSNQQDSADFTLDVDVVHSNCLPDSLRCFGNELQSCDADASGDFDYQTIQSCAHACDDDHLLCVGPEDPNNSCGSALTISSPGRIVDDFDRFLGAVPLSNCFDSFTEGPDAFYEVELAPQQGLIVEAQTDVGSNEVGLYLAEGCLDFDDECDTSVQFEDDGVLEYYSPQGGTYMLGLYGISDFDSGEFILDFDLFDGECDPEADNVCIGETAEQCNHLGVLETIECDYGCDEGQCLERVGNFCERPFDIDELGTVDSDGIIHFEHDDNLAGYDDGYNPADDGDSCTGSQGAGPDVVFAFEGFSGDEVELTLTSQFDGLVWVTTDCEDAAASCIAGANDVFGPSTDSPEQLSFTVPHHGTYYVIADAVHSAATGDFTLEVAIDPGDRLTDPALYVSDDPIELQAPVEEQDQANFDIENQGQMELTFQIDEDADWLEVDPEDGLVDGEASTTITLTATCPEDEGTYQETLEISSNAPFDSTSEVDVTLDCEDDDE